MLLELPACKQNNPVLHQFWACRFSLAMGCVTVSFILQTCPHSSWYRCRKLKQDYMHAS